MRSWLGGECSVAITKWRDLTYWDCLKLIQGKPEHFECLELFELDVIWEGLFDDKMREILKVLQWSTMDPSRKRFLRRFIYDFKVQRFKGFPPSSNKDIKDLIALRVSPGMLYRKYDYPQVLRFLCSAKSGVRNTTPIDMYKLRDFANLALENDVYSDDLFGIDFAERSGVMKKWDLEDTSLEGRVINLYLPDAAYLPRKNRQKVHDNIVAFFRSVVVAAMDCGLFIIPRLQFHNGLVEDSTLPTISYHTKGFPGAHWKESHVPGYFSLDSLGYSGSSHLTQKEMPYFRSKVKESDLVNWWPKFSRKILSKKITKYEQKDRTYQKLPDKFIFLALQLPDDAVAEFSYIDTISLLEEMTKLSVKLKFNLVVKFHPLLSKSDRSRFTNINEESLVVESEENIHDLIEKSFAVVTVNSGVGFESLIHLKTVVTTGKSDYGVCTKVARDSEMLESHIRDVLAGENQVPPNDIKCFLYYYFNYYLVEASDSGRLQDTLLNLISKI